MGNVLGEALLADLESSAGPVVGEVQHLGGFDGGIDLGERAREGHVTLNLQVVGNNGHTTRVGLEV